MGAEDGRGEEEGVKSKPSQGTMPRCLHPPLPPPLSVLHVASVVSFSRRHSSSGSSLNCTDWPFNQSCKGSSFEFEFPSLHARVR